VLQGYESVAHLHSLGAQVMKDTCQVMRLRYRIVQLSGRRNIRTGALFPRLCRRLCRGADIWEGRMGRGLHGYLAHKNKPHPLGSPQGPRHRPTLGS